MIRFILDTIVSGDRDLLDVSGYAEIKIMKPAVFVKQFDL